MGWRGSRPAPRERVTLAKTGILVEGFHRLPREAGWEPAIVRDWQGSAVVMTKQTFQLGARVCPYLLFTTSTCSDWSGTMPPSVNCSIPLAGSTGLTARQT